MSSQLPPKNRPSVHATGTSEDEDERGLPGTDAVDAQEVELKGLTTVLRHNRQCVREIGAQIGDAEKAIAARINSDRGVAQPFIVKSQIDLGSLSAQQNPLRSDSPGFGISVMERAQAFALGFFSVGRS
jgi:hypothetical protein